MVQITEDYVSFETAKLLKEKGFPQDPYICTLEITYRDSIPVDTVVVFKKK